MNYVKKGNLIFAVLLPALIWQIHVSLVYLAVFLLLYESLSNFGIYQEFSYCILQVITILGQALHLSKVSP